MSFLAVRFRPRDRFCHLCGVGVARVVRDQNVTCELPKFVER